MACALEKGDRSEEEQTRASSKGRDYLGGERHWVGKLEMDHKNH